MQTQADSCIGKLDGMNGKGREGKSLKRGGGGMKSDGQDERCKHTLTLAQESWME